MDCPHAGDDGDGSDNDNDNGIHACDECEIFPVPVPRMSGNVSSVITGAEAEVLGCSAAAAAAPFLYHHDSPFFLARNRLGKKSRVE